jgi:chemotaxis signal transduction protein
MTSVVAFTVGDLGFTIPLGAAREVLRVRIELRAVSRVADGRVHRTEVESGTRWLFPLPEAPPGVLGLVAHRSLLVPVVDVHAVYGLAPDAHSPPRHLLVLRVLRSGERRVVALLVDRVVGVRRDDEPPAYPFFPFDEGRIATLVGALAPLELV